MMKKYTYAAIFQPKSDGGYVVSFPQLPGCEAQGTTFEEAANNARDAMGAYLRDMLARKEALLFSDQQVCVIDGAVEFDVTTCV